MIFFLNCISGCIFIALVRVVNRFYKQTKKLMFPFLFRYRVTHKDWDFGEDCAEFILSVYFYSIRIPCNCTKQSGVSSFVGYPVSKTKKPSFYWKKCRKSFKKRFKQKIYFFGFLTFKIKVCCKRSLTKVRSLRFIFFTSFTKRSFSFT